MESAFQAGAGFLASDLNFFVRGMVAALFAFWALWTLYNQFKLVVAEQITIGQWIFNGVVIVIVLTMVLVIVGR